MKVQPTIRSVGMNSFSKNELIIIYKETKLYYFIYLYALRTLPIILLRTIVILIEKKIFLNKRLMTLNSTLHYYPASAYNVLYRQTRHSFYGRYSAALITKRSVVR